VKRRVGFSHSQCSNAALRCHTTKGFPETIYISYMFTVTSSTDRWEREGFRLALKKCCGDKAPKNDGVSAL
jgi:hypothetical protein